MENNYLQIGIGLCVINVVIEFVHHAYRVIKDVTVVVDSSAVNAHLVK